MKKGLFLFVVLSSSILFSQKSNVYNFGRITQQEYEMKIYPNDSTANAVFIFENGETQFYDGSRSINIKTKYYAKVKIFNKEGFDNATIEIPIYHSKERSEKVIDIKAVTHNGIQRSSLKKENIFTEKVNDNWSIVKFTMPNIKEQSIIEYEYTLESPFKFNFTGWKFQSEIPKIYSRFYALIPGNYLYNRKLIGFKKLSVNKADIKRGCFSVSGISRDADCEALTYVMEDIPAFIEEGYMTSKKNYLSRIKFELSKLTAFNGAVYNYTKSWKSVDKEFKTEKSIGKQLRKVDYIEKRLPKHLFEITDDLEKATEVFNYIKNHFTWNSKTRLFKEVKVKKAFEEKIGNSTEINIALINALNAVGLKTDIVLISTRPNGLPTKIYPVISDFNYAIARIEIKGIEYLLDATDKLLPFGVLPFKTLNAYGRVMNFKKGSYWIDIKPKKNNLTRISMNLTMNEDGNFEGKMQKAFNGYKAIDKRKKINSISEEKYLEEIEEKHTDLTINSYKKTNLDTIDKPLKELFDITIESELNNKTLFLNPFLDSRISTNPFKLKERSYPIDFGYPWLFQFSLKLTIPENYKIKALPTNTAFKLPNNGGKYIYNINQKGNVISMISRFSIVRPYFLPEEYPSLKEFFNQIIKTQNSLITLEKIK